jgi:CheY-like chemotaxis protein
MSAMQQTNDAGKTILVVDDEVRVRGVLEQLLEDEGYQVAAVRNGKEAIEYLEQNTTAPCLILLDMMMPEMTGVEFLTHQQSNATLATIPVVAMSASLYLAQNADVFGVTEYIHKPFDFPELLSIVTRHCGSGTPLNG